MWHQRVRHRAVTALLLAGTCVALSRASARAADTLTVIGDVYPLDYCLVSGEKLGSEGEPASYVHNGRDLKFCCPKCVAEFKKTPDAFLAKLDSAIIEQQLPYYPLATCVVSGEKLGGEMGKPVNKVINNRLVRFCCNMCLTDFTKTPGKYLDKLDSAVIAQQGPKYPLETCPVSGMKLGKMGAPVDYVQGNRLVRFCCSGCVGTFRSTPTVFLAKIDSAQTPGPKSAPKPDPKHGSTHTH